MVPMRTDLSDPACHASSMANRRPIPTPRRSAVLLAAAATALLSLTTAAWAQETWLQHPLTDAATGETFMLSDYAGRALLVETMATWCSNCRRMLGQVERARRDPSAGDAVFVALSVEGALPPARLAAYAEREGFGMRFAVATPELIAALVRTFGRVITDPPSTPHFRVGPGGEVSTLRTGIEDAPAVLAFVRGAVP